MPKTEINVEQVMAACRDRIESLGSKAKHILGPINPNPLLSYDSIDIESIEINPPLVLATDTENYPSLCSVSLTAHALSFIYNSNEACRVRLVICGDGAFSLKMVNHMGKVQFSLVVERSCGAVIGIDGSYVSPQAPSHVFYIHLDSALSIDKLERHLQREFLAELQAHVLPEIEMVYAAFQQKLLPELSPSLLDLYEFRRYLQCFGPPPRSLTCMEKAMKTTMSNPTVMCDKKPRISCDGYSHMVIAMAVLIMVIATFKIGYFELTDKWDGIVSIILPVVLFLGYLLSTSFVLKPRHAGVITLMGRYVGTIKEPGFWWRPPFCHVEKIYMGNVILKTDSVLVNDKGGRDIEIGVISSWSINDAAKAAFGVEDVYKYVCQQYESVISMLAAKYSCEDVDDCKLLQSYANEIEKALIDELNNRLEPCGVGVAQARISYVGLMPKNFHRHLKKGEYWKRFSCEDGKQQHTRA